ncbi:MAG TPA: putative sugar O-methyltransferase [Kribbellaceae bacterium]|nr:putative sugar O-methyltransferase [Kribbellaceae bacterium]
MANNQTRLSRTVTRRLGGRISALGGRRPAPTALTADGLTNAAWAELTARTLEEIRGVDAIYRPTNFWGPALDQLLADMAERGLENFKSWSTSKVWFYPLYGHGFSYATIDATYQRAKAVNPSTDKSWLTGLLTGGREAGRDFDVVRLAWDQDRWPFDLTGHGESRHGTPPQYHRLTGAEHGWTRPYLNYLLCLTALSKHVDAAPKSFLEIGGGYGVLGEILLSRDPEARYVNLDIPPLMTVSSYYLTTLFGDRVATYDADMVAAGELELGTSAVLPNWRITNVRDDFDVFVNSYSFQEMEPHVVEHYIDAVAEAGVEYVVSLNSRHGKPRSDERGDRHWGGVIEPVTSQLIVDLFSARGYRLAGRYNAPLIYSAGELVVLRKAGSAAA